MLIFCHVILQLYDEDHSLKFYYPSIDRINIFNVLWFSIYLIETCVIQFRICDFDNLVKLNLYKFIKALHSISWLLNHWSTWSYEWARKQVTKWWWSAWKSLSHGQPPLTCTLLPYGPRGATAAASRLVVCGTRRRVAAGTGSGRGGVAQLPTDWQPP